MTRFIPVSGGQWSGPTGPRITRQRRIGRSGPPTGNFQLDDNSSSNSSDDDDDVVRPTTARTRSGFSEALKFG